MIFLDISKPIEVYNLFISRNGPIHSRHTILTLVVKYLDFADSIGSIESISQWGGRVLLKHIICEGVLIMG